MDVEIIDDWSCQGRKGMKGIINRESQRGREEKVKKLNGVTRFKGKMGRWRRCGVGGVTVRMRGNESSDWRRRMKQTMPC